MKVGFALFALVAAEQPSFEEWAAQYGFNSDDADMKAKYDVNVADIEAWNADPEQTATFGVNQFSGMSFEEFAAQYLTAKPLDSTDMPLFETLPELESRVSDVDWSVTPVKDQGSCGSCWAFGTFGSVEHLHKLKTGSTVSLAEQQLVDCSKQNSGCNGGRPDWALSYLSGKSIYTTSSYPYTARDGSCKSGTASGVTVSGYSRVTKSQSGLESALGSSAVTVMVYADSHFQSYKSGILSNPPTTCSLNHAVLATGYGSSFLKIKNSWGTGWGESGYIRVAKTTSGCGPFGIYYDYPVVPTGTTEVQV
jgi:cathepsin L